MRQHVAFFDKQGWEAVHLLSCPGDLRECGVTIACRELTGPPYGNTGWYEVGTKPSKTGPILVLIQKTVPSAAAGMSKRTGYSYRRSHVLPKGAE